MSDPYIVIEFPDKQRAAQRVRLGTTVEGLEDLWQSAWEDYGRPAGERIRVGLGHGSLGMRSGHIHEEVSRLSTKWLGYRDAKLPAEPDDGDDIFFGHITEDDKAVRS